MMFDNLQEAAEMAAECECPISFAPGPQLNVVQQHHRHACPALRRRPYMRGLDQ